MEWFAATWIFCILVGALIGKVKGRVDSGVIWSALFGPIGWVAVALMGDLRPKCPHCRGTVVEGARKCMHCGEELFARSAPPVMPAAAPIQAVRSPAPAAIGSDHIACPLCGQLISISTLKPGDNYCPHCFERFVAE
jgi:hypothetical protein